MDDETGNAEAIERARLRRNQRNSRARKQAYIRDLEDRWNECVKLGAQATVEMQAAARKVQTENILLRRILARQGFGQDAIARALENEKMAMGDDELRMTSQQPANLTPGVTRQGDSALNPWLPGAQLPVAGHGSDGVTLGLNPDLSQSVGMYNWLRDLCDIKDAFSLESSHQFADQSWQEAPAAQSDDLILANERSSNQNGCNLPDLSGKNSTPWPI